jgi:hypothetical protein
MGLAQHKSGAGAASRKAGSSSRKIGILKLRSVSRAIILLWLTATRFHIHQMDSLASFHQGDGGAVFAVMISGMPAVCCERLSE